MRRAEVLINGRRAAELVEHDSSSYELQYVEGYMGPPISLTLPVQLKRFSFRQFPPFFEGLLPEGAMLEALLRTKKIDRNDYFSQIIAVGSDLVGYVTVRELNE